MRENIDSTKHLHGLASSLVIPKYHTAASNGDGISVGILILVVIALSPNEAYINFGAGEGEVKYSGKSDAPFACVEKGESLSRINSEKKMEVFSAKF